MLYRETRTQERKIIENHDVITLKTEQVRGSDGSWHQPGVVIEVSRGSAYLSLQGLKALAVVLQETIDSMKQLEEETKARSPNSAT